VATVHVQLRQNEDQRATEQEIELDGVRFRLRANYSSFSDRWYVSIFDLTGTMIVGGLACVPGIDMLRTYQHLAIPAGQLFCSAPSRLPPTFTTLDTTSRVLYREV
jgi:hypothetical protein